MAYQQQQQQQQKVGTAMFTQGTGGACPPAARPKCPPKYPLWKKVIIEGLATYVVILAHLMIAGGVDAVLGGGGGVTGVLVGYLLIALFQGLSVYHIASVFYRSGAHANPWVTILALLANTAPRIKIVAAGIYIVLQIAFGLLAALTARALLGASSSLGLPTITTSIGLAILTESLLSFVSYLTYLVVASNYQDPARSGLKFNNPALVGGFTHAVLVLIGLFAGTGGAVNTLRWFAPAVFVGFSSTSWIYPVSHLIGGIAAFIVYFVVIMERTPKSRRG